MPGINTLMERVQKIWVSAFFLNLGFAVIEIVGGIWTNSVAIISDAVHDFGDAFSIGVSYFLERYSRKKRTVTFTYGYKRFSTLGALINSIVLLVGSIFVFMETIPRLFHPAEVNYSGMMWLGGGGTCRERVRCLAADERKFDQPAGRDVAFVGGRAGMGGRVDR